MFIAQRFSMGNCIVFGKKRKGKDLLFQAIIKQRNKKYFSTIPYGYKYNKITLSEISLDPNTYNDLINGTVTQLPKNHEREKKDIYISDTGIHLPSQYNHLLNKKYPSMPLYFSLSGHCYDSNIHCNYNGAYTRLWDKLREQADEYFRALKNIKLPHVIYVKVRYYAEEQSANQNVLPFKGGMDKQTRSLRKQHKATFGDIQDMWIRIPRRIIKYDTRHFEKVFFTPESLKETKKEIKKWYRYIRKRLYAFMKNKRKSTGKSESR